MKIKSFLATHKTLVKDVITSVCLLGGATGIVFGVSAGTFRVNYMSLSGAQARYNAYLNHNYLSEKNSSQWNMKSGNFTSDGTPIPGWEAPIWRVMKGEGNNTFINDEAKAWWNATHDANTTGASKVLWSKYNKMLIDKEGALNPRTAEDAAAIRERYNYVAMVIDGASHTTMDRSFNQSLYQGLIDFNRNTLVDGCDPETGTDPVAQKVAKSFKPTQDNTTDFIQTYASVIQNFDVVGLAGFNHSTPLNTMMTHAKTLGGVSPLASNPDRTINRYLNESGIILLDANIPNNQNIASVQFRSDQPAFLSALATCQYFYNNLHMYHDHYQDLSVGIFGGVAIPTVTVYMGGFQRGVEFFNQVILEDNILTEGAKEYFKASEISHNDGFPTYSEANLKTFTDLVNHSRDKDKIRAIFVDTSLDADAKYNKYKDECFNNIFEEYKIKVIKLGGFGTHFTGTFASGDAIGITKQFLNRGASAIIAVAGPQSLDSAQEIRNQNSNCIVIGVDSAMEDGDYQRYHIGCDESSKIKLNEGDKFIDATKAPDGSKSSQANAIIKFSAVKDIRSVTNKITKLCASGENWDVDAEPYESNYTYDGQPAVTLDASNAKFTENDGKLTITGFADNYVLPSDIKTLIIPSSILVQGEDKPIVAIADNAFCSANDQTSIPNIVNIRIDYWGGGQSETKQPLSIGQKAFGNAKNLICVDINNFKSLNEITFSNNTFSGCGANTRYKGVILIDDDLPEDSKSNIVPKFKEAGLKGANDDWYLKAPDLLKSICGPGFQTCCNIKNGLISISWDGFYDLLHALSHVKFHIGTDDEQSEPLSVAWVRAASRYFAQCSDAELEQMGKAYTGNDPKSTTSDGVKDLNNINTFKKEENGKPTTFYENYSHTMAILGTLLDKALVTFTANDTLVPDPNNPERYIILPDGAPIPKMSILEWLDCNMYMMEE